MANRVLSGAAHVRLATRERVRSAAGEIGLCGIGSLRARVAAARPRFRFGILLPLPHRPFCRNVARAMETAAARTVGAEVNLRIEFLEDLSPQNTASSALSLATGCRAVGIVSAAHPTVTEALTTIQAQGVAVFALVAPLSATGLVPYVGLDNWKLGRTAAWAFAHLCLTPGRIGMLVGNPRFRNQEISEASFRSCFREFAPDFTLLEPLSAFESAAVAQDITEALLARNPDMVGLYVNGGGVTGAIAALHSTGRAGKLVVIGHDPTTVTRAALLDGSISKVMSHPLDVNSQEVVHPERG